MLRRLEPFMAVEEKCRGSYELYDKTTATPEKTTAFTFVPLSETRLRLWNSLAKTLSIIRTQLFEVISIHLGANYRLNHSQLFEVFLLVEDRRVRTKILSN